MGDPVVVESWHVPRALSDEALRLLTKLPMEEIEARLRGTAPTTDGEVAELVALLRHEAAEDEECDHTHWLTPFDMRRAADLLERQAAAAPMAADGEVAELPPRPPLMEPPAHLALERYGIAWDRSFDEPVMTRMTDGYWTPWHIATDLLERQALRPIPVSERLPGPDDCSGAGDCWWYSSFASAWIIGDVEYGKRHRFRHWLPAHALPEVE